MAESPRGHSRQRQDSSCPSPHRPCATPREAELCPLSVPHRSSWDQLLFCSSRITKSQPLSPQDPGEGTERQPRASGHEKNCTKHLRCCLSNDKNNQEPQPGPKESLVSIMDLYLGLSSPKDNKGSTLNTLSDLTTVKNSAWNATNAIQYRNYPCSSIEMIRKPK